MQLKYEKYQVKSDYDSRHSLQMKISETSKMPISSLASTLTKLQSSKTFQEFREAAKGMTKKIGEKVHELAAKVDEYARGMIGPLGTTFFKELGLYYIGPVDGHNIGGLVSILREVKSRQSIGLVPIHGVTKTGQGFMETQNQTIKYQGIGIPNLVSTKQQMEKFYLSTCVDYFVQALTSERDKDDDIVIAHAPMGVDMGLSTYAEKFLDKCFDDGMVEQHAVTFATDLECEGLKPFCVINSSFLQRAYDQVIHDVDLQKLPIRFVMAPSNGKELFNMVGFVVVCGMPPLNSFSLSLPNALATI